MTNFPTRPYASFSEIPTVFQIPEALRKYPFRAESPTISHYREYCTPSRVPNKVFETNKTQTFYKHQGRQTYFSKRYSGHSKTPRL